MGVLADEDARTAVQQRDVSTEDAIDGSPCRLIVWSSPGTGGSGDGSRSRENVSWAGVDLRQSCTRLVHRLGYQGVLF